MKRKYDNITCKDCGGPALAPNSLTLYCQTCRLARGALWHSGQPSTCAACSKPFIAWNGYKTTRHCGRCFLLAVPTGARESVEGKCQGRCGKVGVLHSKDIAVCPACLTDPSQFERNKQGIITKYRSMVS